MSVDPLSLLLSRGASTRSTRAQRRAFIEFTDADGRLPHLPGLDGLRGLAVAGVVLFHLDLGFMVGGYLGVSTFFTLSGFLITSLLLGERRHSGTVDFRAFWGRRFRRLMPASVVTLFAVATVYAWIFAVPSQLDDLRAQVWAALAQVANWQLILSGSSYGDLFSAPSPLVHFWSLAIEEQFYLLFPVVLMGLWWAARGSRAVLGTFLVVLIAASAAEPLIFDMDNDRVYFGTDTRAAELLLGALLALVLTSRPVRRRLASPSPVRTALLIGAVAAAALQIYWWITLQQTSDFLYSGGLTVYALLTCLIVTAACLPGTVFSAWLSGPVLGYLGARSYGIYLIHWPVILAVRQTWTSAPRWLTAVVAVSVALLLAEASYRWVEEPIRRRRSIISTYFIRSALGAAVVVALVALTIPSSSDRGVQELDFDAAAEQQEALLRAQRSTTTEAPTPTEAPSPGGAPATTVPPEPPVPSLATFGDSTALLTGLGMLQYAAETGLIVGQAGDSALGCGVSRFELRRVDQEFGITDECRNWPDRWREAIEEDQPNVVQLITASWEITDAMLPGADSFSAIGDPSVDAFIKSEIELAVEVLHSRGALVLLVLWPEFGDAARESGTPGALAKADPARMERLHQIMREIAEENPEYVRVLDLATMLQDRIEDRELRPDGVHIAAEQMNALYHEQLGAETLRLWEEFWLESTRRLAAAPG